MDFGHSNYGINVTVPKNREIIRITTTGGHGNPQTTSDAYKIYTDVNTLER